MSSMPARTDQGTEPMLRVRDLSVSFGSGPTPVRAVQGVSFDIGREKVAIVGESGSGKSTVGRTILKLQPKSARISAVQLRFQEVDLLTADERAMLAVRGRRISMILQDPKFSLNPVMTIGDQIGEAYRVHHQASRRDAKARAVEMLEAVRIRNPKHVAGQYPHQVSGGMGQRAMIAMMLIPSPQMIIADEPTSALDVTIRLQVLAILDDLVAAKGLGLMFITHDLNLVRSFCDRVLIMYQGRVVEELPAGDLDSAEHPYTRGLLDSLPTLGKRRARLPVLQRSPAWLATNRELSP